MRRARFIHQHLDAARQCAALSRTERRKLEEERGSAHDPAMQALEDALSHLEEAVRALYTEVKEHDHGPAQPGFAFRR